MRIFINSIEYSGKTDYTIRERSGQTSRANFSVLKGTNPTPETYMILEATEDDLTPVFTGIIYEVSTPSWSSGYETFILELEVRSLDVIFENRLVIDAFENMYAHEIVDAIFDDYLAAEGLTKGTIETFGRYYEKYVSNGLPIYRVFQEIGDSVNAVARVGADKVFTFRSKATLPETTPPAHIKDLKRTETGGDLVTLQRLTGASEETSLKTQNFVWVADQETMTLGYQISSISGITINGVPVNVGILGRDSGDASVTFLYRTGEQVVTLNTSATTQPSAGDNVVIVYYGNYSIEIQIENESLKNQIATLSGSSGIIERLEVDTSILNYADGESKAQALLDQHSERENELSVEYVGTELWKTEILTRWVMNRSDLAISGTYVIVSRTIKDFFDKSKVRVDLKKRSIFARVGEVLRKNDKTLNDLTIRIDDLVAKTNQVEDYMNFYDEISVNSAGVIFYPSGAGDLWEPATLDGFFPV